MSFCTLHFNQLREAINHRGLGHLCTSEGPLIQERAMRWLEGSTATEEFDPLVVIGLELHAKAHRCALIDYSGACVLCLAAYTFGRGTDTKWVEGHADLMSQIAERNNIPAKRILLS